MHHCVQELFGDPSEPDSEKLECLAKLLTSIGKKLDAAALDKKESAKFMKAYFKQLKKLENNKALDARLRFALKDLRELRENTWVPRRKVEEAKTIQEIHDDIQVRFSALWWRLHTMASTRPLRRERTSGPRNASKRLKIQKETSHDPV